jgi:hypothetical protein
MELLTQETLFPLSRELRKISLLFPFAPALQPEKNLNLK